MDYQLDLKDVENHIEAVSKKSNLFTIRTMIILCFMTIFMALPLEGFPYFFYENEFYCREENKNVSIDSLQEINSQTSLKQCSIELACNTNTNPIRGKHYTLGNYVKTEETDSTPFYESLITQYGIECNMGETYIYPMFYNLSSITGSIIGICLIYFINNKNSLISILLLQVVFHVMLIYVNNLVFSYSLYFLISQNYHLYHTLIGIYAAEFTIKKSRSKWMSIIVSMNGMCGIISLLIFYLSRTYLYSIKIYTFGLLLSLTLVGLYCKESIKYNILKGNVEQAKIDLDDIAKINNSALEYYEFKVRRINIARIDSNNNENDTQSNLNSTIGNITKIPIPQESKSDFLNKMKAIILISLLYLINHSIELNIDLSLRDSEFSIAERIIFYVVEIILCFISSFPMDLQSLGRKGVLIITMITLFCLFFCKYFFTEAENYNMKWIIIVIKAVQVFFETTLYVFSSELFPTVFSRNGILLCKIISRLLVLPYPYFALTNSLVTMIITVSFLFVGFLMVILLKVNTEEIQNSKVDSHDMLDDGSVYSE